LWSERNKWREEGRRRTDAQITHIAAFMTDRLQELSKILVLLEIRQHSKWCGLAPGELKLYSDEAFDSSRMDGGCGFAIRDDSGRVLQSGAGQEDSLLDSFHAELLGCLSTLNCLPSRVTDSREEVEEEEKRNS
jgi:hypothetical protein